MDISRAGHQSVGSILGVWEREVEGGKDEGDSFASSSKCVRDVPFGRLAAEPVGDGWVVVSFSIDAIVRVAVGRLVPCVSEIASERETQVWRDLFDCQCGDRGCHEI